MKKPLNRWSLVLWTVLAIAFIGQMLEEYRSVVNASTPPINEVLYWWDTVRNLAVKIIPIGAFAVLIELVDQIRWNALPPEDRTHR